MSAGAASTAHAQIAFINASTSGAGQIAGLSGQCGVFSSQPNGTITNCGLLIAPVGGSLIAVPQPTPAGHWVFSGWVGCPAPIGTQCIVVNTGFTVRAVFTDGTPPTLSGLGGSQIAAKDGTITFTWNTNEPLKAAQCNIDGGAFHACSTLASDTVSTSIEGTHTLGVKGTDLSGNAATAVATVNVRIIETTLDNGPTDISNNKSPTFTFSSKQGTSFDCSLDSGTLKVGDCAGGTKSFTDLTDGKHTFRVRATDGPVNDPSTLVRTWVIDTVAPTTTLSKDSGPGEGALQAINTETFDFSASEASTFQCRLDAADFADCAAPFKLEHLKAGQHRFEVRAIDKAGNVGAAVARNWSVAANDDDNDGFNAQIDCNDADPSIRPGALEVLDNGVDENCDGVLGTTPPPPVIVSPNTKPEQILVTLAFFSSASKKTTKFTSLSVKNVPLGATVTVTCKGKGCPSGLKRKGFTKKNAFGTVSLKKFIKKPLKAKDVITVVVSKPGAIAAVKVLTIRSAKKPLIATKCLPPGAKSPVAC
jgi:hypothetical protein